MGDLYINEDVHGGFGTIAPTTTPGKFGKDLFRWTPINNDIMIVTDYPALTIVVPPKAGGIATVKKSAIEYSPPLDYVGADVIAVEGCIQSDCYRFDITVEVMGKEEDVGVGGKYSVNDDGGGEEGWNKLWLLLLLLLLIPCVCVPLFYFLYQKKKKAEEENEYESADGDEDGDFRDVFEDDIEDESDISIEDSSEDEDQWSSEEDEDSDEYDDDTGFDDESLNSR